MARRSLRGRRWEKWRLWRLSLARWRCERCGRASRLEVHHRTPIAEGGARFSKANTEVLCRDCHIRHHAPVVRDFPPGRAKWAGMVDMNRPGSPYTRQTAPG